MDPKFADAQVADTNKVKELVYFCSILNRPESKTLGLRPDYLGFKMAYVGILSTQFRHWILNQDLFLKDMISTKCPRPEKSKLSEPISTERLILRPLIPSDFQSFRSLREDPYVLHLLAGRGSVCELNQESETMEDTQNSFEHALHAISFEVSWGVFLKDSEELIGMVAMHVWGSDLPSISYYLKENHWGHGYATEFVPPFISFWRSLPRMTRYIPLSFEFRLLKSSYYKGEEIESLWGQTHVDNKRSQRVLNKVGFERVIEKDDCIWWRYTSEG